MFTVRRMRRRRDVGRGDRLSCRALLRIFYHLISARHASNSEQVWRWPRREVDRGSLTTAARRSANKPSPGRAGGGGGVNGRRTAERCPARWLPAAAPAAAAKFASPGELCPLAPHILSVYHCARSHQREKEREESARQ